MRLLQLFRVKNLLIVAVTQFLLQFLVVLPYLKSIEKAPVLDFFHFTVLVFVTVLIAAGGYVINDIFDIEIDSINKPEKTIVGNIFSKKTALKIYYSTVLSGGFSALFLAYKIDRLSWFLIYPIAVFMLWAYARYFKKMSVIGNLVVAFFSAGVAGIVLFPEIFSHELRQTNARTIFLLSVFAGYIFFAFSSTMYREIVKDLEDMEGDRKFGARTLPIVSGVRFSKIFAGLWGGQLALVFGVLTAYLFSNQNILLAFAGMILVLIPLLFSFIKLVKAEASNDYHFISQLIKVVMAGGLIFLFFLVKLF